VKVQSGATIDALMNFLEQQFRRPPLILPIDTKV
jgi:hypothetical protein